MEWENTENVLVHLNKICQVSCFDEEIIFYLPTKNQYFGITGCGARLVEFLLENQDGLRFSQLVTLCGERLDSEIQWEEWVGNAVRELDRIGAVDVH